MLKVIELLQKLIFLKMKQLRSK